MITESGGAGVNDLFMDPSGPWWPLGIHQTDANREGGRMGRVAVLVLVEHRWKDGAVKV